MSLPASNTAQLSALQWQYLTNWYNNSGSQPPLILSAADATTLESTVAAVQAYASAAGKYAYDHLDRKPGQSGWTIAAIQALLGELTRKSLGDRRLVVVHGVETLTGPAANSLLKALEEPQPSTRYILTTRWPRRLPVTIRSRCQLLRLTFVRIAGHATESPIVDTPAVGSLAQTSELLSNLLRERGPSLALRRAYLRLRDYYLIQSKRGNEKLAREVLLLSLPGGDGMSKVKERM